MREGGTVVGRVVDVSSGKSSKERAVVDEVVIVARALINMEVLRWFPYLHSFSLHGTNMVLRCLPTWLPVGSMP